MCTVLRDKTILLYAIHNDIKFDVGHVIDSSVLESTNGRCIRALTHASLVTMICKLAGVRMIESEEQCPPLIPLPLPKTKKAIKSPSQMVDNGNEDSEKENEE